MSIPAIAPAEDVSAERWRQWERANAQSSLPDPGQRNPATTVLAAGRGRSNDEGERLPMDGRNG